MNLCSKNPQIAFSDTYVCWMWARDFSSADSPESEAKEKEAGNDRPLFLAIMRGDLI